MTMKPFNLTLIAAALLLLAESSRAEMPWQIFKRFGITGNWSVSCADKPSASNFWMTYKEGPGGKVVRPLDRGKGNELSAVVDSAEMVTAATMRLRFRNDDPTWGASNGQVSTVLIEVKDGRIHTLESKGDDGKEYIKDGIVVASGKPIPWLEKCGRVEHSK